MRHPRAPALCGLAVAIAMLGFASVTAAQTTCVPPPDGLVAWWPGDGNAQDIAGSHHGVAHGINYVAGKVGLAFSFDGAVGSYVEVPHSTDLTPAALTIDAWIRPGPKYPCYPAIVKKAGEGADQIDGYSLEMTCWWGYQGPAFWAYVNGSWQHGPFVNTPFDAWSHVAAVYDGASVEMYVNGVSQGSAFLGGAITPSGNPLRLGGDASLPEDPTRPFLGLIDEVEIFSRALGADEIQAIYAAGAAGKCKVLPVTIDIKPGSSPNAINLSSSGVVPVAILSSATFDATTVDPATVSLAGASVRMVGKSGRYLAHLEDVNADALVDLLCQVTTAQFMIEPGQAMAVLEAQTYDGQPIRGQDSIQIVP